MHRNMRHFTCKIIYGLLITLSMIASGCGPVTTQTGQNPVGGEGEKLVATPTTETRSSGPVGVEVTAPPVIPLVTETPWLPPPPDLRVAESWQPYPPDFKPSGDAEVQPGYEPMRNGVAAINPELENRLVQQGFKVNTARTVVLPEEVKPTRGVVPEGSQVIPSIVLLKEEDILCLYRRDCARFWTYTHEGGGQFGIEGTGGAGILESYVRKSDEPGSVVEGLYGYEYLLNLTGLIGNPQQDCIHSLSFAFGPVTPVDYDKNGNAEYGYFYPNVAGRPVRGNTPAIFINNGILTAFFDPPVCAGTDPSVLENQGGISYIFGFASIYPPRKTAWQIKLLNGVSQDEGSSYVLAPDYPKEQVGLVELGQKDINCAFVKDCESRWNVSLDALTLDATGGSGFIDIILRPPGDAGTIGEGLYGYEYDIDLAGSIGRSPLNCLHSFTIDFGPVVPLDYDYNGTADFGFAYPNVVNRPIRGKPPVIEVKENMLTAIFDPPLCAGTDTFVPEAQGDLSYHFGFASIYPPRSTGWQAQDINGITYQGKNISAPDYTQAQSIRETVSIAPVAAAVDPGQFGEEQLQKMFETDGVILGMLVLESNAPDSRLPPGAYLERAYLNGDQGMVELIEVTSGQTMLKIPLLSKKFNDPSLVIPSASIFIGSKICITCLWSGWYVCRDCFFWETATNLSECPALLSEVTPSP